MATTTLKKFTTIQEMFSTTPIKTAFPIIVGLLALSLADPAQAGKNCGGLNQKSCWNINPAKWCNTGLKYVGTGKPGDGRCVKPRPKPKPVVQPKPERKPACGGLNQKSCWNVNPAKWCNTGLKYVGTGKPGDGRCVKPQPKPERKPACGGLNQKSCWNVNPAKWCNTGLKYFGTGKPGDGRCIKPGSDPTPNCGGENQKSCWNPNPRHWCDDGMSYSPGVLPNQGTCYRKLSKAEYKAAAKRMYETVKALGVENPMFRLRTCLLVPGNLSQLKNAMKERSKNGINRILSICGVSPQALKSYGERVLGAPPRTLEIGLSGGVMAGVGIEGSVSYAIPLVPRPDGRFFLTNGLGGGAGLAGGVDVTVGLTAEEMPIKDYVSEKGRSINFSGKALAGGGVSIDFPERDITPHGFTISGGVGAGAEYGTMIFTRDQYLKNW